MIEEEKKNTSVSWTDTMRQNIHNILVPARVASKHVCPEIKPQGCALKKQTIRTFGKCHLFSKGSLYMKVAHKDTDVSLKHLSVQEQGCCIAARLRIFVLHGAASKVLQQSEVSFSCE